MVIRCNINHDFKSTFLGSINLNLDDYQGRYWNKDTSRKMKKKYLQDPGDRTNHWHLQERQSYRLVTRIHRNR